MLTTIRAVFFGLFLISSPSWGQGTISGITFKCSAERLTTIEKSIETYFNGLAISHAHYTKSIQDGHLNFVLNTDPLETSTLYFKYNPQYQITNEVVEIPSLIGTKKLAVASKKEIVLSLMQHGRNTIFTNQACHLEALQDNVNLRQMIVAWSKDLEWEFPEGDISQWHDQYWNDGTPLKNVSLIEAVNDVFMNQKKYVIGCYAATKLVMIQASLDYFHRVKQDKTTLKLLVDRLMLDGEPMLGIEDGQMWFFEEDITQEEMLRVGKIMHLQHKVAPENFVPGDWAYFLNPDPQSNKKLGYEGSNVIYLGGGLFDDFYNDNDHHYLYNEKLREVYQWRNGVFSRSRDYEKLQPISAAVLHELSKAPPQGLVFSYRAVPYLFGHEDLPPYVFVKP